MTFAMEADLIWPDGPFKVIVQPQKREVKSGINRHRWAVCAIAQCLNAPLSFWYSAFHIKKGSTFLRP